MDDRHGRAPAPVRDGWLTIEVSNDQRRFVDVPGLARYVIEALDVRDGSELSLSTSPVIVQVSDVDHVIDVVCSPGRNGLVFVGGTDDRIAFSPYAQQVAK